MSGSAGNPSPKNCFLNCSRSRVSGISDVFAGCGCSCFFSCSCSHQARLASQTSLPDAAAAVFSCSCSPSAGCGCSCFSAVPVAHQAGVDLGRLCRMRLQLFFSCSCSPSGWRRPRPHRPCLPPEPRPPGSVPAAYHRLRIHRVYWWHSCPRA